MGAFVRRWCNLNLDTATGEQDPHLLRRLLRLHADNTHTGNDQTTDSRVANLVRENSSTGSTTDMTFYSMMIIFPIPA